MADGKNKEINPSSPYDMDNIQHPSWTEWEAAKEIWHSQIWIPHFLNSLTIIPVLLMPIPEKWRILLANITYVLAVLLLFARPVLGDLSMQSRGQSKKLWAYPKKLWHWSTKSAYSNKRRQWDNQCLSKWNFRNFFIWKSVL